MLLVRYVDGFGERLAVFARPDFSRYLIALVSGQLAAVQIDLSILNEKAYHLMVCGGDGFHVVQPRASQDGVKGGKIFYH